MARRIAGYAVIFEQYGADGICDYSRCIGVFRERREALGAAYAHAEMMIRENSDDERQPKNYRICIPEELEGQTGEFIKFYLTDDDGAYTEEFNEVIYEVWEEDEE